MRVGCGLRVRRIDGNEYLYFWHYEREEGRSARREDYVGPARDAGSRRDASRKLLAYHRRPPQDLRPRSPRRARTARPTLAATAHPPRNPRRESHPRPQAPGGG